MKSRSLTMLLALQVPLAAIGTKVRTQQVVAYDDFLLKHSRSYSKGSPEYHQRTLVFLQTQDKVAKQNSLADGSWKATLNKFSDWFDHELKTLRGYRHSPKKAGLSFSQEDDFTERRALPETMDWRNLSVSRVIPDQGACGSCWAVAAVSVLNSHHEIHRGHPADFSVQELVNCVPNPEKCGGEGGCKGATVELALAYAKEKGLAEDSQVPYTARDGTCAKSGSSSLLSRRTSFRSFDDDVMANAGAAFGLMGFTTLTMNAIQPLLRTLAEVGPVAVSVAADDWVSYDSGVFNGNCGNIVDHAVTLFGYGQEAGEKYWIVKNSWGKDWGENGYIRLKKRDDEEEEAFCAVDEKPEVGIACAGDTHKPTTCGMCGILYDSVVPQFNGLD